MRLLFVTHNVPRHPGDAAGSFVLRLAVALRDAGHRVEVVAPGGPGLPARDAVEGIPIDRVAYAAPDRMTLAYTGTMAEAVRGSWGGRLALWGLLRALRRAVVRHLEQARREGEPVDVVHAHWWFPAGLALWGIPRRHRVPMVVTMHGSDVRLAQGVRPAHPVMRGVLAQAAACTAVSRWLADAAAQIAPASPVSVAPMPVATALFPVPDPGQRRDGILFAGRLNAQKGVADLLEALTRPLLAHASLDVVGDGPDALALRTRSEALGVAGRVRWHGALPQPELARRYRAAAVVAMPSRAEGLGLVAVEAQLCGTPVVAYADGGLTDVVRPEDGGTLVPPGDVGALTDALERLLGDPDGARRRGGMARAAMLEQFSPDAVAARYLDIYRSALGAMPPNPRMGGHP